MKSLYKHILDLLWLIRVPIVVVSVMVMITAFRRESLDHYVLAVIPLAFVLMSGYIINDILDLRIDKISASNRPLPSGRISLSTAKLICTVLIIATIILLIYMRNVWYSIYLLVYLLMFYIYTVYLKSIWIIKNSITALFFSSAALVPILWGKWTSKDTMILFLLCFAFTFSREILMDVRDKEGDRLINNQRRPEPGIALSVFATIQIITFLAIEIIYLDVSIMRYAMILLISGIWFILNLRNKRRLWILSEYVKLLFLTYLIFINYRI